MFFLKTQLSSTAQKDCIQKQMNKQNKNKGILALLFCQYNLNA